MQNFDTTSAPVRTVDAESLSEIANSRNVEKSKFAFSPVDKK